MNKVIVSKDEDQPDAMVAYGPFNEGEAEERVEQLRSDDARFDSDAHKTYTVCDLL